MGNRRHRGAGLLPAAVEEIKRLRAEWAALKDTDLLEVSFGSVKKAKDTRPQTTWQYQTRKSTRRTSEVLRGVVALVEVGTEPRALPLRAALTALGATVVPLWSPLVTHVVWSEGGDRESRKEARASAASVVSPLWVEACATSNQRVSEKNFPAAARPSDLPSPNTMLTLLKKAEEEKRKKANMSKPTSTVTSRDLDSDDSDDPQDTTDGTRRETSASVWRNPTVTATAGTWRQTSTSRQQSGNSTFTAHDVDPSATDVEMRVNTLPRRALPQSYSPCELPRSIRDAHNLLPRRDGEQAGSIDVEMRVNTFPRRALPASFSPPRVRKPDKAMRRLFTQREVEPEDTDSSESEYEVPVHKLNSKQQLCAGAGSRDEELRRRVQRSAPPPYLSYPVLPPSRPRRPLVPSQDLVHSTDAKKRIVLTGMSRTERRRTYDAVKQLEAKVQKKVNYKTTHVLLGNFGKDDAVDDVNLRAMSMPGRSECPLADASSSDSEGEDLRLRTLNALAGGARGCRVLFSQWAVDSARAGCWLAHRDYAVPHLETISEKAYVERRAFDLMDAEYAYDVFRGRRVRMSPSAENRHAAEHLLALCGAVVVDATGQVIRNEQQDDPEDLDLRVSMPRADPARPPAGEAPPGRRCACNGTQSTNRLPEPTDRLSEVVLGTRPGHVSSRWVFDSVASARMRSLRRYTCAASG